MEILLEAIIEPLFLYILVPIFKTIFVLPFEIGFLIYGILDSDWSSKRREKLSPLKRIAMTILGTIVIVLLGFAIFSLFF